MKRKKGFTLVELMIAMAIVAILATAGIQAYTDYVKKSRDTARGEMARNLNSSVMAYAASNGGKPPANSDEFSIFLASAGETFGGGSVSGGSLSLIDPVGGKNVCLDAEGGANQPCSFNYTAYDDGTYAISYGVEHESSTQESFYKTTNSVPAVGEKTQKTLAEQSVIPKYGVYVGNAKYIGQTATPDNGSPANDDGVDQTYIPPDGDGITVQPLVPVFRSIRVDSPVGVTEIAPGSTCTQLDICEGEFSCVSGACRTTNVANGDPCDVPEQCTGALSCLSGACRTTNVANGDPCDVPEQCATELTCMDGACGMPECTQPGDICLDSTVYVTATMRTTSSNVQLLAWRNCNLCGGTRLSGCYTSSWGYACPTTGAKNAANGKNNIATLKLISPDLSDFPAAQFCDTLIANTYDDWYLPAKNELNDLYLNGIGVGSTGSNSPYWSSTEANMAFFAWNQFFYNDANMGLQDSSRTMNEPNTQVRCIRTL